MTAELCQIKQFITRTYFNFMPGPKGTQLEIVYGVFENMHVLSACFMSFAHGGNDFSNAIGPLAAALSILQGGASGTEIVIPMDVLSMGRFWNCRGSNDVGL